MNTTTISRREELCRSLNMNFDEASELFCDETLQSMQMAKVNGGELIVATFLLAVGAGLVATYLYDHFIAEKNVGTPPPGLTMVNGQLCFEGSPIKSVSQQGDSLIIVLAPKTPASPKPTPTQSLYDMPPAAAADATYVARPGL